MKVVINKCYGGFGISRLALLELIKMKSKVVEKTKVEDYFKNNLDDLKRFKPFKEGYKQHEFIDGWLIKDGVIFTVEEHDNNFRTNSDVIKVVKKLKEKANGDHAELEIINVPNNVEWEIEEYDGIEWIAEKHRTWG